MAKAKVQQNGRLEEAMTTLVQSQATLVQNQAALVQNHVAFLAQAAETDRRLSELQRINAERFGRIEAILLEHGRILKAMPEILKAMPEAIREKIGFKVPQGTDSK